ncbi:MAG: hypothetical protein IJX99_02100 [Clostridia bacterium]|nr:hypothetical protein [Clostridia bacterium]
MEKLYLRYSLLLMIYQFAEEKNERLYTNSISALENAFDAVQINNGISKDIVWNKIEEIEKILEYK